MIEEIKRKLKGNQVFLKCINKEEFISKNEVNMEILNLEEIEVQYYQEEGIKAFEGFQLIVDEDFLEDRDLDIDDMFISIDEVAYFEIVKNKPTFNDLIDVAVKAYKDGIADEIILNDDISVSTQDGTYGVSKMNTNGLDVAITIEKINSLYTETFVIESEEDIMKVNPKDDSARIILANKTELELSGSQDSSNQDGFALGLLLPNGRISYYGISVLKGATVTQKRGK